METPMGKSKAGRPGRHGGGRVKAGAELAALLRQHQEEIATAWAEMLHGLPGSSYRDLPAEEVRSLTLWGLTAIMESLETGSRVLLEDYLAGICPAGSQAVPDAAAVTEALLLCKDAAVPVIRDACGPDSSATWALVSELDACLRWMVGRLTSLVAADMGRQLQAERARVAMLLDTAQTASSTLELDEVVSRVAEGIVAALGVDRCVFHLVDEEQRSAVYIPQPSDWSSRVVRSFDSYTSIFHEALTTRQPVTTYDVESDPRIPQDYKRREPDAKSSVVMPLLVKGKVVAMAGAYTVRDYRRFTEEEIALAQGIGNVLGLVIQNAQLYEQSKLLTVMEERGRLAREIHDGLAQTLGALQLKASQVEDSLPDQQLDESRSHLSDLQEMISRAYRDLREAMFGLRAVVEPGSGLVPALREYLAQYRAQYGLDVRLEASEDEPAILLDAETQAQVVRIVQEALRNVLRHAGTGRATLRVDRHGDGLRICVVDEGQGFDPSLLEGRDDGRYLGLHTMRERAESVGGTLSVESRPGQGTTVVLQLPLYEDGGPE
jgi:signal transduction histidine kinase